MFIRKYVDSTRYSKSLQEFMMSKMLLLLLYVSRVAKGTLSWKNEN